MGTSVVKSTEKYFKLKTASMSLQRYMHLVERILEGYINRIDVVFDNQCRTFDALEFIKSIKGPRRPLTGVLIVVLDYSKLSEVNVKSTDITFSLIPVIYKKEFVVPLKRASNNDPKYSFTIRTNDLPNAIKSEVKQGEYYNVTFNTGDTITVKATRKGSTLYTGKLTSKPNIKIPNKAGVVTAAKVVTFTKAV